MTQGNADFRTRVERPAGRRLLPNSAGDIEVRWEPVPPVKKSAGMYPSPEEVRAYADDAAWDAKLMEMWNFLLGQFDGN